MGEVNVRGRRVVVDGTDGGGWLDVLGKYVALSGALDVRNWGLGANVRWYPPKYGRLPLVVSAHVGPFAVSVYLGAHR